MDELIMRFEAPDSKNRWDSPLFTIQARLQLSLEVHLIKHEVASMVRNFFRKLVRVG
jgi:tRNA uridine 5-carbamoylmethylation protein Kti12